MVLLTVSETLDRHHGSTVFGMNKGCGEAHSFSVMSTTVLSENWMGWFLYYACLERLTVCMFRSVPSF